MPHDRLPSDRLIVEIDQDMRWITFLRPDRPPSDHARGGFQLPAGFTLDEVLEAARATGWVVDAREGHAIDQRIGCTTLCDCVREMLCYFDAPAVPSKRLLRVKQAIDQWLAGDSGDEARFSLWVCAWLDLVIHDDAREDLLRVDDVWRTDFVKVDVGRHRQRRLQEVLGRSEARVELVEPSAARMAPSERMRRPPAQPRREVG